MGDGIYMVGQDWGAMGNGWWWWEVVADGKDSIRVKKLGKRNSEFYYFFNFIFCFLSLAYLGEEDHPLK